jgi:hypothetical protein
VQPDPGALYDRVIANPPFDCERDIDHVMHALRFLAPDGCLTAIMSAGTEFRETRKAIAFRALMDDISVFTRSNTRLDHLAPALRTSAASCPDPRDSRSRTAAASRACTALATVDRTFVLPNALDRALSYVALSRHRESVRLYAGRDELQDLDALKATLGRWTFKQSTLDYARGF